MQGVRIDKHALCDGMQVRSELGGFAKLPAWTAASPNPSLNLPSFSAYPQACAPMTVLYCLEVAGLKALAAQAGVQWPELIRVQSWCVTQAACLLVLASASGDGSRLLRQP